MEKRSRRKASKKAAEPDGSPTLLKAEKLAPIKKHSRKKPPLTPIEPDGGSPMLKLVETATIEEPVQEKFSPELEELIRSLNPKEVERDSAVEKLTSEVVSPRLDGPNDGSTPTTVGEVVTLDKRSMEKVSPGVDELNISSNSPKIEENGTILGAQTEKVTLRYYVDLVLSSIWVILPLILVCVGIGFLATRLIPKTYQATTTIMVSQGNLGQAANYDTVWTGEQLASTYADMVTGRAILDQVSSRLDSSISTGDLSQAVMANPVVSSQLIEITVEHSNPELTVKIANTLVDVFSSQLEQTQLASATYQDNLLQTQLQELESEITSLQEKIREETLQLYTQRLDKINASIAELSQTASPAYRPAEYALLLQYQNELVSLTVTGPILDTQDLQSSQDAVLLDQKQRIYYNLLQAYQNMQVARMQNMVRVTQIDQPVLPDSPVRPKLMVNLILGFAAGVMLSFMFLFIKDLVKSIKKKLD